MTRHSIPHKVVTTPLPEAPLLDLDLSDTKPDPTRFRSMVGSISYIANVCRPDCAHAAHALARKLNAPSHADMRAAVRTCQYLHTTRLLGLTYSGGQTHAPEGAADADWAGCPDTRESTTGTLVISRGAAVMWSSHRQRNLALSSAESEYVAANHCARDIVWFRRISAFIGNAQTDPTRILEDSSSALRWCEDYPSWSKTRHVDIKYRKVNEYIRQRKVLPVKVHTNAQPADCLTKSVPHATLANLRPLFMGVNPQAHLSISSAPAAA